MKNERKVSKLTYFTLNNYNHTHYELQDMYYENKNFQQYVYLFFCLEQKNKFKRVEISRKVIESEFLVLCTSAQCLLNAYKVLPNSMQKCKRC